MLNLTAQEIKLLIEGAIVGIGAIGVPVCIYLKKKGFNFDGFFNTAKVGIEEAEKIVDVADEIAPTNTVINIAEEILKWSKIGVDKAQQLYHASQLNTDEERELAAKETVYTALKEFDIIPTENQEKLISDTIYACVNKLGHKTPTEAEKEVQKQAQINQIQTQNQITVNQLQSEKDQLANEKMLLINEKSQLETENVDLKNKIAQVQNTIGVITNVVPDDVAPVVDTVNVQAQPIVNNVATPV